MTKNSHRIAWAIRDGQCRQARWKQDGFDVRAMVIADPDGWFDTGIFMYGKFAHHWQAGAVRHWQGNERTYPWFIPADPSNRHEYYRRACDFGDGWSYVGVKLIVTKQGVTLATEIRLGIESEADVEAFTEDAFELADMAMPEAQAKMKELCDCGKAALISVSYKHRPGIVGVFPLALPQSESTERHRTLKVPAYRNFSAFHLEALNPA